MMRASTALAIMCLLACEPLRAQNAPAQTSVALPSTSLTFATTYLAADLGLFEDAGLQVKVLDINGVGAPNSVISGSVDFTLTTASTFSRAAARGQRLLIIANMIDRPQMDLVLRRSTAEQAGYDPKKPVEERGLLLKGRTIAVDGVFTNLHGWLQLVARKAGLNPEKDLKVTPMPAASMLAAMSTGAIDGFSSSQPWTAMAVKDKTGVILASSFQGDAPEIIPFAYSVLVTRPEVCQKQESLCDSMARAYKEAARILREEPVRATLSLAKRFPDIPRDVLNQAVETIRRSTPEVPAVTIEGLQNSETFNVKSGVLKAEETLKNYDGLYTTKYVQ